MPTPCNPIVARRAVHVSLGMYGRMSHRQAIEDALFAAPVDPLLGKLSVQHLQLCPQNKGQLTPAAADDLRSSYPGIHFRLHANVQLEEKLRRVDLCDWPHERNWFEQCADISKALGASAYTAHAGRRSLATVEQVLHYTKMAEHWFGIAVGIEGHYPTRNNTWLISTWEEYRQMFEARVHYALDMSHLNILAVQSGRVDVPLVVDMLASSQCLEVHVSGNDGTGDQHLPLVHPPWWMDLMEHVHPDAVIFSEGRQHPPVMAA